MASGARVPLPEGKNVAMFMEARYEKDGRAFSLSSPTRVFEK